MARYSDAPTLGLPRPGPALKGVLIGLFAVWLMFAVGINWASVSPELFELFCGNTERILHGEVWRLFTAPVMHHPVGDIWHILSAILGLYFLGPSLEKNWGPARFLRFLLIAGVVGYSLQTLLQALLPGSVAERLAPPYWYGALPVLDAVAIAWALSFRGQVIRLFFVLPVSSRGLIFFVVGVNVLYLIAGAMRLEGTIAPFGGMLAGWGFGGGTPSPIRKAWLKFKLARLDAEVRREAKEKRQRAKSSHLRVIEGGRDEASNKRGPDGRFLN